MPPSQLHARRDAPLQPWGPPRHGSHLLTVSLPDAAVAHPDASRVSRRRAGKPDSGRRRPWKTKRVPRHDLAGMPFPKAIDAEAHTPYFGPTGDPG